jgi:Heterokaryon incompatibility protein (HET)
MNPSFPKLLSTNISAFQACIPVAQLPKTFRDAVQVTRRLGYQYLWIDALCIIQDSQQDWLQESASMTNVYSFSRLNLAAEASVDANGGLFSEREPAVLNGCDIPVEWESPGAKDTIKQIYHVSLLNPWFHMLQDSPLQKRAWAFQERLLSPRTLHFAGDQIFWECFDAILSESNLDMNRWGPHSLHHEDSPSVKEQFASVCRDGNARLALVVWSELIKSYSRRAVTYSSDKMVALSGVAAKMALAFRPDDYLAGIWRQGLPRSLLWRTLPLAIPAQRYRAPSWSWASIDGEIAYDQDIPHQVVVCELLLGTVITNGGSFGPVSEGLLVMKGFVCDASLVASTLRKQHTCRESLCPYSQSDTDVKICLDEARGFSSISLIPSGLFLLPVVFSGALPLGQNSQQRFWSSAGLILKPTQNSTGRFQRVGIFKAIGTPSNPNNTNNPNNPNNPEMQALERLRYCLRHHDFRKFVHLAAHSLRSWAWSRTRLAERDLYTALVKPRLQGHHYRAFDGISQYTIEIV